MWFKIRLSAAGPLDIRFESLAARRILLANSLLGKPLIGNSFSLEQTM
jgi:hypothetical protein